MPGVDQTTGGMSIPGSTRGALDTPSPSGLPGADSLKNGFVPRFNAAGESYDGTTTMLNEMDSQLGADSLIFDDSSNKDRLFARLRTMCSNRELCDVTLEVGNQELYAHRVVLAAASPYFYELFTSLQGQPQGLETSFHEDTYQSPGQHASGLPPLPTANQTAAAVPAAQPAEQNGHGVQNGLGHGYIVSGGGNGQPGMTVSGLAKDQQGMLRIDFRHFPPTEFELLVKYAYSSELIASPGQVKPLYTIANQLRMKSVARACGRYLAARLCTDTAIGLRACANSTQDMGLTEEVDAFIRRNFHELAVNSKEFAALPSLQAEVTIADAQRSSVDHWRVAERVLTFIEFSPNTGSHATSRTGSPTIDLAGSSRQQQLYKMNWDDHLPHPPVNEPLDSSLLVVSNGTNGTGAGGQHQGHRQPMENGRLRQRRRSSPPSLHQTPLRRDSGSTESISGAHPQDEVDWQLIASQRLSESNYVALVVADRRLCSLSVRLRPPSRDPDEQNDHDTLPSPVHLLQQQQQQLIALEPKMVMGGRVVETEPEERYLARMHDRRCSAGVVTHQGKIIVCGGYDRGKCLDSVEVYDPATNAWSLLPPMNERRGRLSAEMWGDKIIAICGSDGCNDLASIELYSPDTQRWTQIADCPLGRSNVASCIVNHRLYVIGGGDGQTTFRNVDCFDLQTNKWTPVAQLNDVKTDDGGEYDKLYVIGGADGTNSVNSVEVLDLDTLSWSTGPTLNVPRTNVDVARVEDAANGTRTIYAVGGFSGKAFLNSMEMLHSENDEWQYMYV